MERERKKTRKKTVRARNRSKTRKRRRRRRIRMMMMMMVMRGERADDSTSLAGTTRVPGRFNTGLMVTGRQRNVIAAWVH